MKSINKKIKALTLIQIVSGILTGLCFGNLFVAALIGKAAAAGIGIAMFKPICAVLIPMCLIGNWICGNHLSVLKRHRKGLAMEISAKCNPVAISDTFSMSGKRAV